MSCPTNYSNLMQANQGILVEACTIMNSSDVEYVVVGGWSPYLRGTGHSLRHPGTHDVDLLFNGDFEHVKAPVQKFLLPAIRASQCHIKGTFNVKVCYWLSSKKSRN